MQKDFHYYGTYCAAWLAGFSHEESLEICYSSQFTDGCTKTLLTSLHAPVQAATTQLALEMANARTDLLGLQDITRIWASFHFLPYNLHAKVDKGGRRYRNAYRLICGPNGSLVRETVELARDKSLQAAGIAMHVLADTWAHRRFAGTPSFVINNVNKHFVEIVEDADGRRERQVRWRNSPAAPDDIENGLYTRSLYQTSERAIMNLGHGRAGHLPDYSFARYRYLPAWADYEEVLKDNPQEYWKAFCQMVYALRCLRDPATPFELDTYATRVVEEHRGRIMAILTRRQADACEDWRRFAETLSGQPIEEFELTRHHDEYQRATGTERENTFLGRYFTAAIAQKSMVTYRVHASGNPLAGRSVGERGNVLTIIGDYLALPMRRGGSQS